LFLFLKNADSATEKLIGIICFADFAIFHIYLIHIFSNLNIRKNSDFWIRILKDSNPQDSIFNYIHPWLWGAISVRFGSQSPNSFVSVREMKYTSQYYCDKIMDDKLALYRECCSPNCTQFFQMKLLL